MPACRSDIQSASAQASGSGPARPTLTGGSPRPPRPGIPSAMPQRRFAMTPKSALSRAVALGSAVLLLLAGAVQAAELTVVSSGGFAAAYRELAPEFERTTGNILV